MPHLTLLQINDTHGYLEPHNELFWDSTGASYGTAGGYARIKALLDRIRKETDGAVITLDNGDTFHGTYPAVHTKGEALIAPLNLLQLDAWTIHWDLAYGVGALQALASKLHHPLLASNCYLEDTGELAFPPSLLLQRGGLSVGIIGIAATIIDKTMPKHFSEGLRFTLGNDELPHHITDLRAKGADVIVVLSHLGLPQDLQLAREVSGIDVILSGHTHNRIFEPLEVNGAVIIQSGCHGSFLGRLDLKLEKGKVVGFRHELIPVDEKIALDPHMQQLVDEVMKPFRPLLSEVIGDTEVALHRNTILEAPMDTLLLEAIAAAADTTLAFSNGWRYGAPVPVGPVTRNDLWNIVPTNPPVSTVELTGAELHDMLEDNLENTFAPDPYRQMGGYVKRCFGLTMYVKVENPSGARIQQLFAGGAPVDKENSYKVSFITSQGVPRKYGRNRQDLPVHAIEALETFLKRHRPYSPASLPGIVAI